MFGRISEGTCNAYIDHYKYCGVSYGGIYGTFSGYASYAGLGSSLYAADRRKRGSLSSVYSMFLHFGIEHLINNMLVLFVLGSRLERVIGKLRFIVIYLAGGMTGSVLSLVWDLRQGEYAVSAGASGAVFAVMGAMIYVVIRNKGRLEDLSVRQILVMAVFSLYFGFASSGVDNAAHTGGLAAGFLLAVFCYHRRKKI